MEQFKIKELFGAVIFLLTIYSCAGVDGGHLQKNGFKSSISYTTLYMSDGNDRESDSFYWSKFYPADKSRFKIRYDLVNEYIVMERSATPDTFRIFDMTEKQKIKVPTAYKGFKFIGAFYNDNLPADFSSLFYYDPQTFNVLEIRQRVHGDMDNLVNSGAVLYLKDSVNPIKNIKLAGK